MLHFIQLYAYLYDNELRVQHVIACHEHILKNNAYQYLKNSFAIKSDHCHQNTTSSSSLLCHMVCRRAFKDKRIHSISIFIVVC